MQTPYQILQLKQKQRKKVIKFLQSERSLNVRYENTNKKLHINPQKHKSEKNLSSKFQKIQQTQQKKGLVLEKKYEIIFRQSIRKGNAYRNHIYHNHSALKHENFIRKFITSKSSEGSRQKYQQKQIDMQKLMRFKTFQDFKNLQTKLDKKNKKSQKFKTILNTNQDGKWIDTCRPQFSVEKCKISDNCQRKHHQKIQDEVLILKKNKPIVFTQNYTQNLSPTFKNIDENRTKLNKSANRTLGGQSANFTFFSTSVHQINQNASNLQRSTDAKQNHQNESKITNFINSKRKKHLPLTVNTKKYLKQFQLKRACTDESPQRTKKRQLLNIIQQGYFSPQKKVHTKIKFNSIQDNLSGWQTVHADQCRQNQQLLKQTILN